MIIIYAIVLLVSNVVTGFFVFKGVQLGLRWQVEVRQERPPTMETPIAKAKEVVKEKQAQKMTEEQQTIFDEWLNGAQERR